MADTKNKRSRNGGDGFWDGFWRVTSAVLLDTRWGPFVRFVTLILLLAALYHLLDIHLTTLPLGPDSLPGITR